MLLYERVPLIQQHIRRPVGPAEVCVFSERRREMPGSNQRKAPAEPPEAPLDSANSSPYPVQSPPQLPPSQVQGARCPSAATSMASGLWLCPSQDEGQPHSDSHEEWRTILEHPGYEVSSLGRFRNGLSGRLLALTTKNGYQYVKLGRKGGSKAAARLVAKAFHGKPLVPSNVVSYRDGQHENLNALNLYWMPHKSHNPDIRKFLARFGELCARNHVPFTRNDEAYPIVLNLLKAHSLSSLQVLAMRFFLEKAPYLRTAEFPALRHFSAWVGQRQDRKVEDHATPSI